MDPIVEAKYHQHEHGPVIIALGEYIRREFTSPQQIGIGYSTTEIAIMNYSDERTMENKERLIEMLDKLELFDNFQIIKIMRRLDWILDSPKEIASWYQICSTY
jgi:hypothetical protein